MLQLLATMMFSAMLLLSAGVIWTALAGDLVAVRRALGLTPPAMTLAPLPVRYRVSVQRAVPLDVSAWDWRAAA